MKKVDTDDGRYYEVTVDGVTHRLISVTTVINAVLNKPALVPWAFNLGVENTLEILKGDADRAINENRCNEFVLAMANGSSVSMKDRLKTREMTTKDHAGTAADRGTLIHSHFEQIASGYDTGILSVDGIEDYIENINKFIEEYGVKFHATELTVFSLNKGYAGTLDAVGTITKHPPRRRHESLVGKTMVIDLKTNKNASVYKSIHFPQLSAYQYALGEMESVSPEIDGSMVVAVSPERYGIGVNNLPLNSFDLIHDVYKMFESAKDKNASQ